MTQQTVLFGSTAPGTSASPGRAYSCKAVKSPARSQTCGGRGSSLPASRRGGRDSPSTPGIRARSAKTQCGRPGDFCRTRPCCSRGRVSTRCSRLSQWFPCRLLRRFIRVMGAERSAMGSCTFVNTCYREPLSARTSSSKSSSTSLNPRNVSEYWKERDGEGDNNVRTESISEPDDD